MIWNLLSNAVKFTPPDGRISHHRSNERDAMIEISVADSGPGIRAEFLPRVFDRFSQQDAGMAREHGAWASVWRSCDTWRKCMAAASASPAPGTGRDIRSRIPFADADMAPTAPAMHIPRS